MILKKYDSNHFPVPIGKYIDWVHSSQMIKTFALQCPICTRPFCLANHTVNNSIVAPSVVCPFNCGFHEFLELR